MWAKNKQKREEFGDPSKFSEVPSKGPKAWGDLEPSLLFYALGSSVNKLKPFPAAEAWAILHSSTGGRCPLTGSQNTQKTLRPEMTGSYLCRLGTSC